MAGEGKAPPPELEERLRAALGAITVADTQRRKDKYDFWETQPVVQFSEEGSSSSSSAAVSGARPQAVCGRRMSGWGCAERRRMFHAGGRPHRSGKDGG